MNIKQLPFVQYERDKELIVKLIFTTRSVRNLVFYVIRFNVFARSVDGGKMKLSVCILSNIYMFDVIFSYSYLYLYWNFLLER